MRHQIIDNSEACVNGRDQGHAEVRCGSKAEVANHDCDVRSTPESGSRRPWGGCPLCANSRHSRSIRGHRTAAHRCRWREPSITLVAELPETSNTWNNSMPEWAYLWHQLPMISFNASFAWKVTKASPDMAVSTGIAAFALEPIFPNVIAACARTCCCSSPSASIKSGTATAADGPNHPRVRITPVRSKGVATFSLPRRLETVVSNGRTATRKPSNNRSLALRCSSAHLIGNC